MALGYLGSWLYNERHLAFTCFTVNIYFPVPQSCDHLAACAFDGCTALIILFLAHFYSWKRFYVIVSRFAMSFL